MVIGSNMLQSHLLSTTTMKRLLLGICWITKDLPITEQTARDKEKVEEGRREMERGRGWVLDWQADKAHGYDVNFHVCQRICVMSVIVLLGWGVEGRTEETPLDACQEEDLSHCQLSINIQRQTHTNRHTHRKYTLTHPPPPTLSPPSSFVFVISYPRRAPMKCCRI